MLGADPGPHHLVDEPRSQPHLHRRGPDLARAGPWLLPALRDRLDQAMKTPLPFDQLLLDTLSPRDQAFAYVAAVWLTGVDQDIDPREQDALDETASRLGIDADRKAELTQLARDLEPVPGEKTAWGDALVTLFKSIPARLEAQPIDQVEVAFEED